jgi:alanine dehydrogenase
VAVDLLAKRDAKVLGLLGTDAEARSHLRAIAKVRTLTKVQVFSPTPGRRNAFAEDFSAELGIACVPMNSAEEAVCGSDVVVAAARSRNEPILYGRWLETGMLAVSIGSTLPEQREIDTSVVARSDLIVCDVVDEVTHETGDMLAAAREGIDFSGKLISLDQLASGQVAARAAAATLPLFKSVGSAIRDLVVAELAFKKADAAGLATPLPMMFSTKGRQFRQGRS